MGLLGSPALPFAQRFNLTYSASLSVIIDTLSLVRRAGGCSRGLLHGPGPCLVRCAHPSLLCAHPVCPLPAPSPQLVTVIYWARVGLAAAPALHVFLAVHAAGCTLELAWRWRCRGAPDGGSYARYRELPSLVMRLNDALLGPVVLWSRALLDRLPAADGGGGGGRWGSVSAAGRHAALLIFGSTATGQALGWAKPLRLL